MTGSAAPAPAPAHKSNRLGLALADYRGARTTLCAGCGHNAISERILEAMFDLSVPQERVVKLSGIGCSSKSPAYFMGRSHAFNALHGRMPSVATGAVLANRNLLALGVSGDGDTASIGLGQFAHLMRRNLPILYIIEDNGVYGLTKGQFSATADRGAKLKTGVANDLPAIDTCALAIQLGATFVARSFSGDKRQLSTLLRAALSHRGTAMLDVISPCVTFNDHEGSTKSYAYMKDHDEPIHELSYVPAREDIAVEYDPGTTAEVTLHDGSRLRLRKLEEGWDPRDRVRAVTRLLESARGDEVLTGLLYLDLESPSFVDVLGLPEVPLATLPEAVVRPSRQALEEILEGLR
jgi:2-oxoglutarate ferredoxin oxidoreductase subunit beta